MIEILSAACGGFLAGWICHACMTNRLSRRMTPHRGNYDPPQLLTADLIRYFQWRNKQIERALRDEPPSKP